MLEKLLRDRVERIWAFLSAQIPSWTELNGTALRWRNCEQSKSKHGQSDQFLFVCCWLAHSQTVTTVDMKSMSWSLLINCVSSVTVLTTSTWHGSAKALNKATIKDVVTYFYFKREREREREREKRLVWNLQVFLWLKVLTLTNK